MEEVLIKMASEKNFENRVKKYLNEKGAYVIKYWGGGNFTRSGVPDLLVCYQGRFLGLEIKAENGKPSELQLHHLEQIRKAGGYAFILRPSDFNDFKEWLEND